MFKDFFFDYIFFRLHKLNVNKDEYQWVPPSIVISLIQSLWIGGIEAVILRSFYDRSQTAHYSKMITNVMVIISVIIMIANFVKYHNRYEIIEKDWESESRSVRRTKGWLIVLVILFSFAPLLIIGIFF